MKPLFKLSFGLLLVSCAATERVLQDQEPAYKVRYTAAFRNNPDSGCRFPERVLDVYCLGNIIVTRSRTRDDDNFVCVEEQSERNPWTKMSCSKCTEPDCLFGGIAFDAYWGYVDFECFGEEILDTDAFIIFRGGPGSCDSGGEPTHEATLGISCPVGSLGRREDLYEDRYIECTDTDQVSAVDFGWWIDEPVYACISSPICDGSGCLFEFEDVEINADVGYFQDACVESTTDVSPYTFAPGASSTNYETSFQAAFGRFSTSNNCFAGTPTVRLECPVGDIVFVGSESTTRCSELSSRVLECTDTTSALGRFVTVAYRCRGPTIQPSFVEFLSSSATCDGNAGVAMISHKVQLGVLCGRGVKLPDFTDSYVECGLASNQFELRENGDRYTCGEEITFPAASQSETLQLPSVSIMTEFQWQNNDNEECYTLIDPPTVSPTLSPVTPSPTAGPKTKEPTSWPTFQPSAPPTSSPISKRPTSSSTQMPIASPLAKIPSTSPTQLRTDSPIGRPTFTSTVTPAVLPTTDSPEERVSEGPSTVVAKQEPSSNSANVGAIVGGVVGAVAILFVVIAGSIFLKKKGRQTTQQSFEQPKDPLQSPHQSFERQDISSMPAAPSPNVVQATQHVPSWHHAFSPNPSDRIERDAAAHGPEFKDQVQSAENNAHLGFDLPEFKDQVRGPNEGGTAASDKREPYPKPQQSVHSLGLRTNAPLVSATPVDNSLLDNRGRGAEPRGRVLREPEDYDGLDLHEA